MALTGEKEEIDYVINKMPSNMQLNRLFHNNHDLTFEESGKPSGFDTESFSNGAAYGDLDNDGDLDLVVNNLNQEAFIYRNNSESVSDNHFISVKLTGDEMNTFALGSKILVYADENIHNTYLIPSRGFQSSVDYKVVIGLGDTRIIDSLVVVWPDRNKTFLLQPDVDTTYVFDHKNSQNANYINPYRKEIGNECLREIETDFRQHEEDEHIDFLRERLVIKMLSREGQVGATGDVNGDGMDDVYLGGAVDQPAHLYIQTEKGFMLKSNNTFDNDAHFEDTAVEFFDADQDGDMDLFVGSGGNHQPQGSGVLNDRVYFNDGQGNFSRDRIVLPKNGNNTSVVCPLDIDQDGDTDLFVGSRSVPMNYGLPPQSYIYENTGDGNFKDATLYFAPFLKSIGMITDAILTNVLGNESKELILIGEWMSPVILTLNRGRYEQVSTNLNEYSGWWYAIESDDVDGDGDQDLIIGNRGENFYFKGSFDAPVKLWLWDFDNNGTVEKIITRQIDGRDMTVALKRELSEQVTSLNNPNFTHLDFAGKSIQDLFPPEVLEKAKVRTGTWFKSSIVINEGDGNFKVNPLESKIQFSSVNAITVTDLNGDQKNDLILGGNDSGFMPQYSKLDASFGHILINKGEGEYEKLNNKESGFFVKGDIRDLLQFSYNNNEVILVLINDQIPRLYEIMNAENEKE